jgi:ATP-dependent DNA ligase
MAFDLLLDASGENLREAPFEERRAAVETFFGAAEDAPSVRLSPATLATARGWLKLAGKGIDCVMAKRLSEADDDGRRLHRP